jgi:aspartyl aminopeptidase
LTAFLQSKTGESVPVFALFDNEEVGSQTKQGAASTLLFDVLERISKALGDGEYRALVANSFMVSCDNAHACHPNHPEYSDKNHTVHMNEGIVIKYNANQRYTSDAVSAAIFKLVCDEAKTPVQYYANRADMPGGSTLGNIANTQVSLNTVDIGLPQLAMHSSFETAGAKDTEYLVNALTAFYSKTLKSKGNGYEI